MYDRKNNDNPRDMLFYIPFPAKGMNYNVKPIGTLNMKISLVWARIIKLGTIDLIPLQTAIFVATCFLHPLPG